MLIKRRLIILVAVIIILTAMQYVLPGHPHSIYIYDEYIFRPYQTFRNMLFGWVPFSIGDVFYIVGVLLLTITVGRWIYYIISFRKNRRILAVSMLHTAIWLGIVYILFIVGWGANYYKPELPAFWQLDKKITAAKDTTTIALFDQYLIGRLNDIAPHYRSLSFSEVNIRSQRYYREYTDSKTKSHGLLAKPSLFGSMMQHLGIQGYYNPFTGEAQVDKVLPGYMLPFVMCHEMAHQSGIAAEGDANLLAYALGTAVSDTAFNYSSYFNIWLYAHSRLKRRDSALAKQHLQLLNALTRAHIDTLVQLRKQYQNEMSRYSGALYDEYLKMHNQKDGIKSYNSVVMSACAWEQKRSYRKDSLIRIP